MPFVLNLPNALPAVYNARIEGNTVKWDGSGHSWIIWGVY